ncbi:MAG: phosphatase PAP2 family protein, partial [Verrucomicrobiota bacterium]
YGRPRPYAANLQVQPCVPLEESTSYPSGHAFAGLCFALLLADIFPEQREALIERGMQIGYDRVVGGVHYPSDVLAGQRLAMACAQVILDSKKWQYWKESAQRR